MLVATPLSDQRDRGGIQPPSSAEDALHPEAAISYGVAVFSPMSGDQDGAIAKVVATDEPGDRGTKHHAGQHAGGGKPALNAADDGLGEVDSRCEMPTYRHQVCPARMKSGIAISGKLSSPR